MSQLAVLRYPQGRAEYQLSDKAPPEVGDVPARNGDRWVVEQVTEAKDGSCLVTVRPVDKPA